MFNNNLLLVNFEKYPGYWGYEVTVGKGEYTAGEDVSYIGAGSYRPNGTGYDRNIVNKITLNAPNLYCLLLIRNGTEGICQLANTDYGYPIDFYINDEYFNTKYGFFWDSRAYIINNVSRVYSILLSAYSKNEPIILYVNSQTRNP